MRVRALAALFAVGLLAMPAARARAGTEEFSTFDVEAQEEDDESLLDHMLTRPPRAWTRDWERAPNAVRTAQGCLTAGQWFNETDLKLRTPLGDRAYFALLVDQDESDRAAYDFMDFSFHFPTPIGTPGIMFRPFFEKARQDFALMWDVGDDTTSFQMRATMGLEDAFNNFWAFRQDRVGMISEPYLRHPWEPGMRVVVRQPALRAELGGRYLTPSRKRVSSFPDGTTFRIQTLWGTLAWASLEGAVQGVEWEVRSVNQQAASTDFPEGQPDPEGRNFRRQWSAESALRRAIDRHTTVELRALYEDRLQNHGAPSTRFFRGIDRLLQVDALRQLTPTLTLRVGGLYDRITTTNPLVVVRWSYGTRTERRAYVGLIARFGRVSVQAIEGIELDHEPYEVWLWHDKGFLQLQATF